MVKIRHGILRRQLPPCSGHLRGLVQELYDRKHANVLNKQFERFNIKSPLLENKK